MHVECNSCGARYTIADERVPAQGARVRCRKCQQVFAISPPAPRPVPVDIPVIPPTPEPVPLAPPAPAPPADSSLGIDRAPLSGIEHAPLSGIERSPSSSPIRQEAGVNAASAVPSSARAFQAAASAGIPDTLPEAERAKHERARRLARVLASDIAIYNKEKRDGGLKDGNLVAVLGYEIKKSWEVYKERITPELANSTPYFRDALNEIVAEGKKIF